MRDRIGEKQLGIDPLEGVAPACPRILSTERSKVDRKRRPDGFQPGYFSGLLNRRRTPSQRSIDLAIIPHVNSC